MIVKVRLFAAAREAAGTDVLEAEVEEGASVAEVRQAIVLLAPTLKTIVQLSFFAVGTEYVSDDVELHANADVVLIPPVSGG